MRKICFTLICLLLLTSCQYLKETQLTLSKHMNPKDLPGGRAFEDEYTRKFIQSTEEVMPRYYPFLVNNGKYEMAFPKEGLMNGPAYTSKDNYESLIFQDLKGNKETSVQVSMTFHSYFKLGDVETHLMSIQSGIDVELEFEEISTDGQLYYIASYQIGKKQDEPFEDYGYYAYIQKEPDAGAVYVSYSFLCKKPMIGF